MPTLFRYFSTSNARAFVEKGEVLFHSLSFFRDLETDGARADPDEGTLVHSPRDGLRVTLVRTGETISLPHRFESTTKEDDILIYCMSTELRVDIAKRFKAEVAVEIIEPTAFLGKLRSSLALRKHLNISEFTHGEVQYYDRDEAPMIDWALPERIGMRKPRSFEWQNEYRFIVPIGNAFRVENVDVALVPVDGERPTRAQSHRRLPIKLGKLSAICRVHKL